jgi:hypothetical protein
LCLLCLDSAIHFFIFILMPFSPRPQYAVAIVQLLQ